ncbi:hypothetical protein [Aestuariivirga sp.]|uniref:hypothetical protein n=1 Tax=Aestuariivirga sp. TaxID=2650926 RepID=UPI0039E68BE7
MATANSAVEIDVSNAATLIFQTVGTYTGALSIQGTVDGTNWITLGGADLIIRFTTGVKSASVASALQDIWGVDVSGLLKARVTALAAVTGNVTVAAQTSNTTMFVTTEGAVTINGTVPVSGSLTSAGTVTNTPAVPTTSNTNSAASTNATSVKASAGTVYNVTATNINAAIRYLKLYNKASAPTVGTDVPVLTIPIPATGSVNLPFGELGKRFATGIAFAITAAAADTDTTAVAASEIKVSIDYV